MTIIIEAEPKEIAALVVAIQERQDETDLAELIKNQIQEKLCQSEPIFQL